MLHRLAFATQRRIPIFSTSFDLILSEPDYQRGKGYEGIRFLSSDPGAVFLSLSAVFRRSRKIFSFEGSTPSSTGRVG